MGGRKVKKELSPTERARIKALKDAGWTFRRIAEDIGCSVGAVKYTLDRYQETGGYETRPGRGCKPKLSKSDVKYLCLSSIRDRRKTATDLQHKLNDTLSDSKKVSRSTISRRLKENGLIGRVAVRKPLLRKQNIKKRLKFALEHRSWTVDDWKKVLWTDESKYEIFGTKRKMYVRRRVGERYLPECIQSTVKHGGGNIMVWGSISAAGPGKIIRINGIMDKKKYHQILIHHGIPSGLRLIGRGFVYQEDNDPKHSSHLCRNYLARKEEAGVIRVLKWPPQSPDLNPIEQIWDHIDRNIDKSVITSEDTLWEEVKTKWNEITPKIALEYIQTMPERLAAVINNKGGHTKY